MADFLNGSKYDNTPLKNRRLLGPLSVRERCGRINMVVSELPLLPALWCRDDTFF